MFIFRCWEKDKASEKEKGQIRKIGAEPGTKNVMVEKESRELPVELCEHYWWHWDSKKEDKLGKAGESRVDLALLLKGKCRKT